MPRWAFWVQLGFALAILMVEVPSALAQQRFALLIGNKNYAQAVGPLKNPHNDVDALRDALKRVNFEVTVVKDATFADLNRAVNAHIRKLNSAQGGAVGFFYYSGHGAQNKDTGVNYLIPVDVDSVGPELWDASMRVKGIMDTLKENAPTATHFVVLDACRNELRLREQNTKALVQTKGFDPVRSAPGMLVAYATAEGETASDAGDDVGPYARVLAQEILSPGIEAVTMFRNVQLRVREATHQEPWLNFGVLDRVYFAGREAVQAQSRQPLVRPLAIEYRALYQTAVLREEWKSRVETYKAKLREYQPRYEVIAEATGVPWLLVGILHAVECSFDFGIHLHNGDALTQRTVDVPRGRPPDGNPPFTWEESAIDAIKLAVPGTSNSSPKRWKLEELLAFFEAYNGFGMRTRRVPNPYLWSGSTHYEKGRYVADGVFDPEGVFPMVGTAVLLKFAIDRAELVKHLGEKGPL